MKQDEGGEGEGEASDEWEEPEAWLGIALAAGDEAEEECEEEREGEQWHGWGGDGGWGEGVFKAATWCVRAGGWRVVSWLRGRPGGEEVIEEGIGADDEVEDEPQAEFGEEA